MLENGIEAFPLLEQMTVFFMLQRYLFKWGGEYEAKDGRYWQLFRALFLAVCEQTPPERYQLAAYVAQWEREYAGRLSECRSIVAQNL